MKPLRALIPCLFLFLSVTTPALPGHAKDYVDPGGAFALRIPDNWQAQRSALGDKGWLTQFGDGDPQSESFGVMAFQSDVELGPEMLVPMGQILIDSVLQLLRAQGTVNATEPIKTKFGAQEALRCELTMQQPGRNEKGYLLALLGRKNAILVAVSAPQNDDAALRRAGAVLATLAIEARTPSVANAPAGNGAAAPDEIAKTGNAQLDVFLRGLLDDEKELIAMQRAFLSRSATGAALDVAGAKAEYPALNAQRLAAKPGSKERALAARKALDVATIVAWAAFDAKNYDEASNWFGRRAMLQKDSYEAARIYQENLLAKREAEMQEWRAQIAATDEAAPKKALRGVLNVLALLQSERIAVLQTFARGSNDAAKLLEYGNTELKMRRAALQMAQQDGETPAQLNAKKVLLADALEHVAEAQEIAARFPEAEKTFLEALDVRRALPADFADRKIYSSLSALGDLHTYTGDFARSRDYYQQALDAVEAAEPLRKQVRDKEKKPETKARLFTQDVGTHAAALLLLGNVMSSLDQHPQALALYERALKLADSLPQEGAMGEVRSTIRLKILISTAATHADSGETDLAIKEITAIGKLWRDLGDDESIVSSLMSGLVIYAVLYEKGELQKEQMTAAKPYAEQARRIFLSTQNPRGLAGTTVNLAKLDNEIGDLDSAARYGEEGLNLARKMGDASQIADAAGTLAKTRLKQSRPDEAMKLLDEAQSAAERVGSLLTKAALCDLRGQILEAKNDLPGALTQFKQAVALLESVRAGAASESNFSNLKSRSQTYERTVRLLIKLNRPDEAFDYLSRAKSKQLQDNLRLANIKTPDPALQALLARFNGLETKLRSVSTQLENEQAKPEAERDAAKIENLKVVVATTQGEYRRVFEQIKATHPNWESNLTIKPKELRETQRSIPPGVVLVQYAPLGEQLYVFVVTKDSLKIVTPAAKPDAIWQHIKAVRQLIINQGNEAGRGAVLRTEASQTNIGGATSLNDHLTALYDMVITPIEADIAGAKTVAFIPNQSLYYLPFHALAKKQGDGVRYLIEDKEIVYLTGADVMRFVQAPDAGKLRGGLVAFGNPTGANLPASLEEVKTIAAIYPETKVLTGADATKSAMMTPGALDKRVVHFATHGVLNSSVPAQSYIQMAKGGAPGTEQLTVNEVWDLPLGKVDLVTLSACETALSLNNPNGGDITTLAEAFSTAGATTVVCSLWSVADESTKDWMVEFYTQLKAGATKAAALRGAQLKVMKNPKYAHPFHWAPFILMGDWR